MTAHTLLKAIWLLVDGYMTADDLRKLPFNKHYRLIKYLHRLLAEYKDNPEPINYTHSE